MHAAQVPSDDADRSGSRRCDSDMVTCMVLLLYTCWVRRHCRSMQQLRSIWPQMARSCSRSWSLLRCASAEEGTQLWASTQDCGCAPSMLRCMPETQAE